MVPKNVNKALVSSRKKKLLHPVKTASFLTVAKDLKKYFAACVYFYLLSKASIESVGEMILHHSGPIHKVNIPKKDYAETTQP